MDTDDAEGLRAAADAAQLDPDTVDRLIRQAGRFLRRRTPPDLGADDLHQIAALALLEARAAGRPAQAEQPRDRRHAENWVRRKCVWAMLDGIRESFAQRPNHTYSLDDVDEEGGDAGAARHEPVAPDDPERIAQLRQALARLDRKGSPQLIECARLLASGLSPVEVALLLNTHSSRVSQLRAEARQLMDPCL
jgi:DNA-directed RNA polymerase specialized sigma24 family protein